MQVARPKSIGGALAGDPAALSRQEKDTALHLARAARDVAGGAVLVRHGARFSFEQKLPPRTPRLVHAAANETVAAAMIVEGGVDFIEEKQAETGRTPLLAACAAGNLEAVSMLIENGADTRATDIHGRGVLALAVQAGDASVVQRLLDASVPVDAQDARGVTPLMEAAQTLQYEIIENLMRAGADVTLQTFNGASVLSFATLGDQALAQSSSAPGCFSFLTLPSFSKQHQQQHLQHQQQQEKEVCMQYHDALASAGLDDELIENRDRCVDLLVEAGASM